MAYFYAFFFFSGLFFYFVIDVELLFGYGAYGPALYDIGLGRIDVTYNYVVLISADRRWPSDSGDPRDLCGEDAIRPYQCLYISFPRVMWPAWLRLLLDLLSTPFQSPKTTRCSSIIERDSWSERPQSLTAS